MLTLKEKKLLENKIYHILKESMFESGNGTTADDNKVAKRQSVIKWLNSDQQIHSTIAYILFGVEHASEDEKASKRSLFSKKFRGHDADGKEYSFSDEEINTLYNLKDRYIKSIK